MMVALALRAADAQQFPPGPPRDPYVQPAAPVPTAPNTTLRYPLPSAAAPPPPQSAAAVRRSVGDLAPQSGNAVAPTMAIQPTSPQDNVFQAGQVIARVGDKVIFYSDVAPIVAQTIGEAVLKAKSAEERERYLGASETLMRGVLRQIIEIKMKYLEFERELKRNIKDDKKVQEKKRDIEKSLRAAFEKSLDEMRKKVAQADAEQLQKLSQLDIILPRLATLMRDHGAESYAELDALLRDYGTTLDKQTRLFMEDVMGREMVRKNMNFHPDITHEEMLDYYRQHNTDYAVPAKAKFEIMTIKWASFPTRDEARNKLAAMGNEVFFGAPFAAVAAKHTQEPNANEGGRYEVSQGSLASQVIDQAVFAIDVGKLSQSLEDDTGCHIIR